MSLQADNNLPDFTFSIFNAYDTFLCNIPGRLHRYAGMGRRVGPGDGDGARKGTVRAQHKGQALYGLYPRRA